MKYDISVWKCNSSGVPWFALFTTSKYGLNEKYLGEIVSGLRDGFPEPLYVVKVFSYETKVKELKDEDFCTSEPVGETGAGTGDEDNTERVGDSKPVCSS